jgi:transposase-like protein
MKTTTPESSSLFKGRHFDSSIIILCLRWYIIYKLSYRDLRDMMAERGIDLAHTTILPGVQRYIPEFEKQWQRYLRPIGLSSRVDETYIRVRGEWKYLYRAVDYQGNIVVGAFSSEQNHLCAHDLKIRQRIFVRSSFEFVSLGWRQANVIMALCVGMASSPP